MLNASQFVAYFISQGFPMKLHGKHRIFIYFFTTWFLCVLFCGKRLFQMSALRPPRHIFYLISLKISFSLIRSLHTFYKTRLQQCKGHQPYPWGLYDRNIVFTKFYWDRCQNQNHLQSFSLPPNSLSIYSLWLKTKQCRRWKMCSKSPAEGYNLEVAFKFEKI